jgi:LPXTG-site transpeptidase (sortase) family protein
MATTSVTIRTARGLRYPRDGPATTTRRREGGADTEAWGSMSASGTHRGSRATWVVLGTALVLCVAAAVVLLTPLRGYLLGDSATPASRPAASSAAGRSTEPTPTDYLPITPAGPTYSDPVRLEIPKLGIDVRLEAEVLDQAGVMTVPSSPKGAGWYSLGTKPGDMGSAVIDGHAGYGGGIAAIFDHLDRLVPGDRLTVVDASGTVIPFVVRDSRLFDPRADTRDIFAREDAPHLNLITCYGPYDAAAHTHSQRLVVFTDLAK